MSDVIPEQNNSNQHIRPADVLVFQQKNSSAQNNVPKLSDTITANEEYGWQFTPLQGKVPINTGWASAENCTADKITEWINAGYNLGLRTGPISGVVVIDQDEGDMPDWCKNTVTVVTGSGGRHYYFRQPQGVKIPNSTTRLIPGIHVRGQGGQVVYPGSIHPDTGKPYLWEQEKSPSEISIAELPPEIILKLITPTHKKSSIIQLPIAGVHPYVAKAITNECEQVTGATEGTRNDTLNKAAFSLGQLVGGKCVPENVVVDALLKAAEKSGLPEHEGKRTIDSGVKAGCANPRGIPENDAGDADDAKKTNKAHPKQADLLVELASGFELFHSPGDGGAGFVTVLDLPRRTFPVQSSSFRQLLARTFFKNLGKVPSSQAIHDAINVLNGKALFEGPACKTAVRVMEHDQCVWLDLCDDEWRAVRVDNSGWTVVESQDVPVKFLRRRGMLPLPVPVSGGNVDELRPLVNLQDDDQWTLFVAWLIEDVFPSFGLGVVLCLGNLCFDTWPSAFLAILV